MASRKNRGPQDKSACRDLNGRRIKAVQDAKELSEYLSKQPANERKAREERRRRLEATIQGKMQVKMDDARYWEDKDRLVESVKGAVKEAVGGARREGKESVEGAKSVGAVKREFKFTGFEEEYEDSQGNVVNKKTYEDLKRQGLL